MVEKKRGGAREGAGRKINSGQYGEQTKTIRIPVSKERAIREYVLSDLNLDNSILYSDLRISAGTPASFDEHANGFIDLNVYIQNNKNIIAITVSGDSMLGVGIHDGDLALVERGAIPVSNDIVIACVDGAHTLKQYVVEKEFAVLKAHHPDVSDILISPEQDITIYGVMKSLIRRYS